MKMQMLPKTHSTTEAERGKNCSFFFATCDTLHLTCFDELQRKKIVTLCSGGKYASCFAIYCFMTKKKIQTEILNLGSLFIFNVLVFKTLLLIPDAD